MKQLYNQKGYNVSHTAFVELFENTVQDGLSMENPKQIHGFRLLVVDGSTLRLENTDELREYFGQSTPVKK